MSQENVEIVREGWRIFAEQGLDAALEVYAEDCVAEEFPEMPDRTTYQGRQGIRDRTRNFERIWGDFSMEPFEFIDAGENVVIAMVSITGRGKQSGAAVAAPAAFVYEFENGKVCRDRAFSSKGEALKAVGLEE